MTTKPMTTSERDVAAVLARYGLAGAETTPIEVGLINHTRLVRSGHERFILQRLHPIFTGEVNRDIAAVTARLADRGVSTPRVVETTDGALWVDADDGVWRVLTFLPGRVLEAARDPNLLRSAAGLVARFHAALEGFEHVFAFRREGVHDTPRHLAHLAAVVASHGHHQAFDEVAPVAEAIARLGADLPDLTKLPTRIVHGDLKITNLLFEEAGSRATALIDLDTVAHGTLATELGDALRSWCNPTSESDPAARFDLELFRSAVEGYSEAADGLRADEIAAIVPGTQTICLELAARFCADALEERYFGWDDERYESRGAHNLARARSQLSLASSVTAQRRALEAAVRGAF